MSKLFQLATIALVTLGTGAAAIAVMNEDIPDLAVPEGDWSAGSQLDGRTFEILGTDTATRTVLDNVIRFRDGTFQSTDYQDYCDFGWSAYETKVSDGTIHFTARTICPDAPHTVVWYGTVDGDAVALSGTWTTRRWYWTNQIAFTATGEAVAAVEEGAAG